MCVGEGGGCTFVGVLDGEGSKVASTALVVA